LKKKIRKWEPVSQPAKIELFVLRFMIMTGVASMAVLLYCLFRKTNVGNAPLYWLLMVAILFFCLKVLHEWYHYFHISVPQRPLWTARPTVDILTTFCAGEPYEMIVETLTALQAITYPHTTYLCDEANDPYLRETCQRLGVVHVTRDNRIDAKAGNINNGLKYATGELCVVLDPDHVPAPDFLDRVVPYFADPKIGFVQIVQAYGNVGDSIIAKGAAQQTFQFYGPMMMTMNKYGTVQAIGANCTFRRSALDSIGGHAAGLAEDMHTAMQLHAKGWKSVYVPEVLTLGLVPATLSAYYKQQLKWARGTFELLVTTYPKLFRHFNWRQRLHYGTLPFHYFSGVISLINFLVPVLSLSLGVIPFHFDLLSFTVVGLPFISITIFVRHFVQRWVMAEEESGFHMVGGLLLIGTWWIFILGLVYTIIRKKVPYIPTPKDDRERTSWKLFVPNAVVFLVSGAAIIYGLWLDWNPYSWVMAGIAFMNCLIMLFNILAGIWKGRISSERPVTAREKFYHYYYSTKVRLWKLRHSVYVAVRKTAMALTLVVCGFTSWFVYKDGKPPASFSKFPPHREAVFYTGIFSPPDASGLTSMQDVSFYQRAAATRFDIVSSYIPWGDAPRCFPQDSLMNAIYSSGATPMITWEPWAALFGSVGASTSLGEQKMMQRISQGQFDDYLEKFAQQLRAYQRPVFLRFAHEPDNPAYPWSATGLNTPEEYRQAWKYVHDFFERTGARNVIWVWNPWKPAAVDSYFPGKAYVDWLAATVLDYGGTHPEGQHYSFDQLYRPFHDKPLFRSGLPVMIAEMGSLAGQGKQQQWLQEAFPAIREHFPEVNATVLFNSSYDRNTLPDSKDSVLNWKLESPVATLGILQQYRKHDGTVPGMLNLLPLNAPVYEQVPQRDSIRGMIYSKGIPWFRNRHTLTRKEVLKDLRGMQQLGVNTIRRYGPGVYDHNVLAAAEIVGMHIQYGFWMPGHNNDGSMKQRRADFEDVVISTIKKRKHEKTITGWHLGNNNWPELAQNYVKPSLLYQEDEYLFWLRGLVRQIRAIDPGRPVTVDIPVDSQLVTTLTTFAAAIPEVTSWGLVWSSDTATVRLPETAIPWFISNIYAEQYVASDTKKTLFINGWQDLQTKDAVTFNGLLDHRGYYKPSYVQVARHWNKGNDLTDMPSIKILRPARVTEEGTVLSYKALVYENNAWRLNGATDPALQFEWFLYKTDRWGHTIYMRRLGNGTAIDVRIPADPALYGVYLVARKGAYAVGARTSLSTPWEKK
jgi:cellulose synthase/poly-beta-1,6-N-acetylglucosamine synthase-like glycosyltransferase